MAVEPLFIADMPTLKARLRLAGVELTDDAQSLVDGATRMVRNRFNSRLGTTRVAEIIAFPINENPTTNDEILRAIAEETEAKWVWVELTRNLPIKFFDNSGDDAEQYNIEGAFRSIDSDRITEERSRCLTDIENWLPILAGTVELGAVEVNKVYLQGDKPGGRDYPLGTLVDENCRLWGNPKIDCEDRH